MSDVEERPSKKLKMDESNDIENDKKNNLADPEVSNEEEEEEDDAFEYKDEIPPS